jgi:hypothetical protein
MIIGHLGSPVLLIKSTKTPLRSEETLSLTLLSQTTSTMILKIQSLLSTLLLTLLMLSCQNGFSLTLKHGIFMERHHQDQDY